MRYANSYFIWSRYHQELSHPDEIWTIVKSSGWLAIVTSSGWLRDQMCYLIRMIWGNIESHPDDILTAASLSHRYEIRPGATSSGWHNVSISISSGWLIADALCHPEDLAAASLSHRYEIRPGATSSGWHNVSISISSGWLIADALCHPDDLAGVDISSGWVTTNSLCHRDDVPFNIESVKTTSI